MTKRSKTMRAPRTQPRNRRRRNAFPFMALAFYLIAIVYPVVRIWWWYEPETPLARALALLAMIAFLFTPFILFVARFILRLQLPEKLMPSIYSAIGCCFLLFPVAIALELIRWIPGFPSGYESAIAIAGVLVLAAYALLNAQRIKVRTIQLDGPTDLAERSIVQLSDVHVGSRSAKYFNHVIRKVEKLDPTWVVITGDLLDSSRVGLAELQPLKRIADKTLMVIGNHERYEGLDRVTAMLRELGITVLRNQEKTVDPFQFIGIDDHETPEFLQSQLQAFEPDDDAFKVLLYHRPHGINTATSWGFDLMLVGHTHRGQIFPFRFVVKRFFDLTHGTHRFDQMLLNVSMGTGTWGPVLRLGSRNEITRVVFA